MKIATLIVRRIGLSWYDTILHSVPGIQLGKVVNARDKRSHLLVDCLRSQTGWANAELRNVKTEILASKIDSRCSSLVPDPQSSAKKQLGRDVPWSVRYQSEPRTHLYRAGRVLLRGGRLSTRAEAL